MGKFKNFFNKTPLGWYASFFKSLSNGTFKNTGLGKFVSSFANSVTGAGLTGAQIEANDFTASEAQKQRDYETMMSNTAYQRATADMAAAGLNPALMYGNATSASTPSGSAAASVNPSQGLSMSDIMQAMMMKSQIANIDADTEKKKADTNRTAMLTSAELDDIVADIDLKRLNLSKIQADIDLNYANIALLESDAKTRDAFNVVNLRMAELSAAKTEAETREIEQQIENLKRDFAISFAKEAEIKANTKVLSASQANLLVQNGILTYNRDTAMYEAEITEYKAEKKEADRVWNNVSTGAGILRDAGVGIGSVVGGAIKSLIKK